LTQTDIFADEKLLGSFGRSRTLVGLKAVKATPTARAVTLASGKYTREMALVHKAAKLGNIGELAAWVL
jgi:hypothetical protein